MFIAYISETESESVRERKINGCMYRECNAEKEE
jgi:hypothetical protein